MRDSYSARLIVLLCLLAPSVPVRGRSCCGEYQTLREEARGCDLIVSGVLKVPDPKAEQSSKEVIVTDIVKPHRLAGGAKVIELPGPMPVEDRKNPPLYLFYCWVDKGRITPYKATLASPAIVSYLKGMLALDVRDQPRRLRYCFNYLEHAEEAIALDAYYELEKCPPRELCRAARSFSAVKLGKLLQAPTTPEHRLSLYGLLLGCCGKDQDALLLRKLIDRRMSQKASFDGVLAGYTLLRPKEGLALARSFLVQPLRPLADRYDVLKMARFFYEIHLGAVSREQAVDLVRATLDQEDINDISIEYLRQWRCWKACEAVLAAPGSPVTRRAVLGYALQCPGRAAAAFVTKARASDPELVEDMEELLKLDAEPQQLESKKGAK